VAAFTLWTLTSGALLTTKLRLLITTAIIKKRVTNMRAEDDNKKYFRLNNMIVTALISKITALNIFPKLV
jgi:hypothetical protein